MAFFPPRSGPVEWENLSERYCSPLGSNSKTGKGWNDPKRTIYDAAEDLLNAGGGSLYVAEGCDIGGPVPGQGLLLRSDFLPSRDYFVPGRGYLPMAPLRIVGCGDKNGGNSFATGIVASFGSDITNNFFNPFISLVGSLVMPTIVVENLRAANTRSLIYSIGVDYICDEDGNFVDTQVANATRTGTTTVLTVTLPAGLTVTHASRASNVTTLTIPNPGRSFCPWRGGVPVRFTSGSGSFPSGDYTLNNQTSNPLQNNETWTISYSDPGPDVSQTAISGTVQTHGCRQGTLLMLVSNVPSTFLDTQYRVDSVTVDTITYTDIFGSGDASEDDIGPIRVQERFYCGTSNVQFKNCSGDVQNISDSHAGHTFDIGHTQAIRPIIDQCWFSGHVGDGSGPRDERRMAGVYVYPGYTPNAGPACAALTVRNSSGTNGSIFIETDNFGVGVVDVRRTLVESAFVELELPALRVDGNEYMSVVGEDIGNADADVDVPTVVLNNVEPSAAHIVRSGIVRGSCVGGDQWQIPATYVATGANSPTPWQRRQVTTWADTRITGKHPGPVRMGAPVTARFQNLIAAPADWSLGVGVTRTIGVEDPFKNNGATRLEVATQAYSQLRPTGVDGLTWEVGGKYLICGWVNAHGVNDLIPVELFRVRTTGVTFAESATGGIKTPYTGTGWQYVNQFLTIDSVSDSTPSYSVEVIAQSGAVLDLFDITAEYIPPSVDDNDAYEYLGTALPKPRYLPVGMAGTMAGQKFIAHGGLGTAARYVIGGGAGEITLGSDNANAIELFDASGNSLGVIRLKDFTVNP